MKRLLNIALLLSSLAGYLEWGKDHHEFLFQVEWELFMKAKDNPVSFLHPMILIPLLGQVLILFSVFQKIPGRKISLIGLACMSTILLLIVLIGIMTLNIMILGSTIPFLVTGILVLRSQWRRTGNK